MSDPLARLAALTDSAWLVGGAVRDQLLGRQTADYDVAVAGETKALARGLGRELGAKSFELSGQFGAWRVTAADRSWQVDLMPLQGETIEQDLARRDLTINAIARGLGSEELIDPYDGAGDLQRRLLRMVGPQSFADDPLRAVRLVRIAGELGFTIDPATAETARQVAPALRDVASERVFAELRQIIAGEATISGLLLLDELGLQDVILPELSALHDVEQSVYHHLDVYRHTLAAVEATIELQRDPAGFVGAELAPKVSAFLGEPFSDELNRGVALRFGALLHDIAKPQTRAVTAEGRVTFFGHDEAGAAAGHAILTRLRASDRLASYVAALTRHHLRLGFLVHQAPLDARALYRYLAGCDPVGADVTLLSIADRVATGGRNSEPAIAAHLELVRAVLPAALAWHAQRPRPPIRGDQLAAALGIAPGPQLGTLLAELTEAAYAGEVGTAEDAVERARALLDR